MKIAILHHQDGGAFVAPLALSIAAAGHETHAFLNDDAGQQEAFAWADVLWLEWGNQHSANVAMNNRLNRRLPTLLRVHRFEAFEPNFAAFPFPWVDALVVPTPHMGARVQPIVGDVPVMVAPYGIDLERFKPQKHARGGRVGMVGNVIPRKDLATAILFMQSSVGRLDRELHVVGAFQHADFEEAMRGAAARATFPVVFHGELPHDAIADFWSKMDFYLSTSWHETGPFALFEAAACGVEPSVRWFPGCDHVPEEFVWDAAWRSSICATVTDHYGGDRARAWVEEKHDARKLGDHYADAIGCAVTRASR